ncbi:MAG TPA: VOC family protein [Thermoanaerobaculia bacterium]|nr:VOC family protein [Thermoanaerobaculia bacterium]
MILGLRTVIYKVPDIEKAREWYRTILSFDPYFDEPFYVGFNVGGFELGLDPDLSEGGPGAGGTVAYWAVKNIDEAWARLIELGASAGASTVKDVGGGIRVATLKDPFGNVLGIIQNPHFKLDQVR